MIVYVVELFELSTLLCPPSRLRRNWRTLVLSAEGFVAMYKSRDTSTSLVFRDLCISLATIEQCWLWRAMGIRCRTMTPEIALLECLSVLDEGIKSIRRRTRYVTQSTETWRSCIILALAVEPKAEADDEAQSTALRLHLCAKLIGGPRSAKQLHLGSEQ